MLQANGHILKLGGERNYCPYIDPRQCTKIKNIALASLVKGRHLVYLTRIFKPKFYRSKLKSFLKCLSEKCKQRNIFVKYENHNR